MLSAINYVYIDSKEGFIYLVGSNIVKIDSNMSNLTKLTSLPSTSVYN